MCVILRLGYIFLIAKSGTVNFSVLAETMSSVAKAFEEHAVVPDIIPEAPDAFMTVKFPSGVEAEEGNELTPTQVKDVPTVSWDADPDQYYTLVMIDPDAPSRQTPIFREALHWRVGNVLGNNVSAGETLTTYLSPAPTPGLGLHRYVLVVYEQPDGKINFNEPKLSNISDDLRAKFSVAKFAEKHNLGDPIAGNFFQAKMGANVPKLLCKQNGDLI